LDVELCTFMARISLRFGRSLWDRGRRVKVGEAG